MAVLEKPGKLGEFLLLLCGIGHPVSAADRAGQFTVRFGQVGVSVWQIILPVETDEFVNRVKHVCEMCLQRVLLILV